MKGAAPANASTASEAARGVQLGACGFDSADGWPYLNASAALGPSNPFRASLTMTACGACFEMQCGPQGNESDATALKEVRGLPDLPYS